MGSPASLVALQSAFKLNTTLALGHLVARVPMKGRCVIAAVGCDARRDDPHKDLDTTCGVPEGTDCSKPRKQCVQ